MSNAFEVSKRSSPGQKGVNRSARAAGFVPAILYGKGEPGVPLTISQKSIMAALQAKGVKSRVYALTTKNDADKELNNVKVLIRDIQFDPVKDTPVHLDFLRVTEGQQVQVAIPLRYIDEEKSPGLKRGGVLNTVVQHLDVLVDVDKIPEAFSISLAGYNVGQSVHLKDIPLGASVQVLHLLPEQTLATVVAPSGLVQEEETSDGGENAA
jgi:large subunit ribosomal protein L25